MRYTFIVLFVLILFLGAKRPLRLLCSSVGRLFGVFSSFIISSLNSHAPIETLVKILFSFSLLYFTLDIDFILIGSEIFLWHLVFVCRLFGYNFPCSYRSTCFYISLIFLSSRALSLSLSQPIFLSLTHMPLNSPNTLTDLTPYSYTHTHTRVPCPSTDLAGFLW